MEAMLALAFNLSGWRGPVAFAAVGIFVVALVARLLRIAAARRHRRAWLAEGYHSRDEVRSALREENIEDWLEKMRSTPPEFKVSKPIAQAGVKTGTFDLLDTINAVIKETSKGVEEAVSLKKSEKPASGPSLEEHGPYRIYPAGYKPDYRFGWYRAPNGMLIFRNIDKEGKFAGGDSAEFVNPYGLRNITTFRDLRVAYPQVGEWWTKDWCSVHKVDETVRIQIKVEHSWYLSPERIAELYCGCLLPMNYGMGCEPPIMAGVNGGSSTEGANGSPGGDALRPPKDQCKLCMGGSEVVDRDASGAAQIVPCPLCKGTGGGS